MSEPRRVLLVFPIFAHVYPEAFDIFLRLAMNAVRACPNIVFDIFVKKRSALTGAMNEAVEIALANNHEALIAFDDDCLPELIDFPVGTAQRYQVIPRLLALLEKGHRIVSGIGYMRGFPYTTTAGRHYPWGTSLVLDADGVDGQDLFKEHYWLDDIEKHLPECDEDGLLTVDFCGVPIIAIHRDVLQKVEKPLFETHDAITGGTTTHDVFFCHKATDAGFTIKVDTHIDCGHIVESPIINRRNKAVLRGTLSAVSDVSGRTDRDTERDGALSDVREPALAHATDEAEAGLAGRRH